MARPRGRKSFSKSHRPARPVRVLVADDHRIFLHALKALLDQQGFLVVAQAVDGREAGARASGTPPDVVVLDRVMPGLTGLAAAVEIARRAPDTAMVLLT